jgi:hypothetical protein
MCRANNGELLTNKNQVLARWERNFWRTLKWRLQIGAINTSSRFERWWSWHWSVEPWGKSRGGEIPEKQRGSWHGIYPSCWKTVGLIWWMHYMQRSSRPGLARHYRETWPRGYCVQCTRRAINSFVKTIEGFASWTWHTKSSPKFYTTAFYPKLTWPFSINQQQTNSLHYAKS